MPELLFIGVIAFVLALGITRAVLVVHEDEKAIISRLGRPERVAEPGPHILIPLIQSAHLYDITDAMERARFEAAQSRLEQSFLEGQ
ncbi:MAG: hypothetical protein GYB68_10040 [Chloroflexi bacterium]|nr:hypothetical protein [Chloroflexota bacterium]